VQPVADSSRGEFRAAWASAAAFGAMVSAGTTAVVLLARACLENPPILAAFGPLVMTAGVFAPFLLPMRWQERAPRFVYPLVTLAVLLSPILVVVTGRAVGIVYPILAAAGLVRGIPVVLAGGWRRLAWSTTAALVLAPYLVSEILRIPYAHIYLPEFALLGPPFMTSDTIFHTSLAHMIESFGRASRGLDGLVWYPYHVASHAWFGFIGRITGTTPFSVFAFVQATLSVPALLTSALLATACFTRNGAGPIVHAAVALGIVLVFDAIGWTSYYIGESQTLGLVIILLALPLLADVADVEERSAPADWGRALAATAVVVVAVATKVSSGALLAAGFGWAAVRAPSRRRLAFLVMLAVAGFLALHWFSPRTRQSLLHSFEPFAFLKQLSPENRWPATATLALPILYLGRLLVRRRLDRWGEVVLVMTLLASVPGLVFRLWDATAWWFWNTSYWIAVPLVASAARPVGQLGRVAARALPVAILVLAIARFSLHSFVALAARLDPLPPDTGVRQFAWEWVTTCRGHVAAPIADRLRSGEGPRLLATLAAVVPDDHRGVAIFIPPSNLDYWKMDEPWACRRRPSYFPALTGLPLLEGIGPRCPIYVTTPDNGFSELDISSITMPTTDHELCVHAGDVGITTVVVLESLVEAAKNRVLRCASADAAS
jgi:hypothetical protein